MNREQQILDALEIVSAWDLPEEDLAGVDPWEDLPEIH
jgi:hypothetical protein